jgi:hypothetical protein
VTCDDDNFGWIRTIEKNGGVLENIVSGADRSIPKLRNLDQVGHPFWRKAATHSDASRPPILIERPPLGVILTLSVSVNESRHGVPFACQSRGNPDARRESADAEDPRRPAFEVRLRAERAADRPCHWPEPVNHQCLSEACGYLRHCLADRALHRGVSCQFPTDALR